ncbi:hypothetical protein E2C01_013272 [Portunus trituberculatus]|uniref:Uncharacterized protein n=1 Tax=Portunus trituberculatus TaxID=210409 RepID=A0A5B7DFS2_PORTR|nr:hypothetical protein [Portunus trituberculatus]
MLRPQENLWPESVEAHTRLGCNTSKVRNPQNCQAASSDHQIAVLSRNSLPSLAASAGRETDQSHPHLGGSVLTKHSNDTKREEEMSTTHVEEVGSTQCVPVSLKEQVIHNDISLATKVIPSEAGSGKSLEEDEDEEEEEEEEEEEDSLNNELNSECEKFVESVDEDSFNLDLEMEGEEDEPDPKQLISEEGEALESDSDSDSLYEAEDDEDALLVPEQDNLVGSADDNEDSLMPDFEFLSEDEDEEISERVDQPHPSQSWETDEDDSEEELYRNLPSTSATDEEEIGWMQSGIGEQNKDHNEVQTTDSTHQKSYAVSGRSQSRHEVEKEAASLEKASLYQEEEEPCPSERTQDLEPLVQQTYHISSPVRGQNSEKEKNPKEEEEDDLYDHQDHPDLRTCNETSHSQEVKSSEENLPCQNSKEPATLDFSDLEKPSTSKSPDNSLTFEGFDWEKTRQASARLLMLLKAKQFQPQRKTQGLKAKTVTKKRGRPSLKGRIDLQGKRSNKASLTRKRNQLHNSATAPSTSESDEEQEEEAESGHQKSIKGKGGRGGTGWMKQRYSRGRPSNKKLRHSSLRRKTLHKQHNSMERSIDKRKTRSSDKEKEKEIKIIRNTRDSYERYAHSPDISSYSEAQPRQPRDWDGIKETENRAEHNAASGNSPAKRPRKRKPSEVDNLLKWAVETESDEENDEELERRVHTHSSSDDPLVNSEEELPDMGKTSVSKSKF